jgi:hypothetical protein
MAGSRPLSRLSRVRPWALELPGVGPRAPPPEKSTSPPPRAAHRTAVARGPASATAQSVRGLFAWRPRNSGRATSRPGCAADWQGREGTPRLSRPPRRSRLAGDRFATSHLDPLGSRCETLGNPALRPPPLRSPQATSGLPPRSTMLGLLAGTFPTTHRPSHS